MRILFIGAHADDIEIGCGGTLLKMIAEGHEVAAVVLTQERELQQTRSRELQRALTGAGLKAANIHMWDAEDGNLQADYRSVGAFREFLKIHEIEPDLVFCHSAADSHGDHRRANDLCRATFRGISILLYSVVNSAIVSEFRPDLWIDITPYVAGKQRMLAAHESQIARGRILWDAINGSHVRYAARIQGEAAEAFETLVQEGDDDGINLLYTVNDCLFTQLWRRLIDFDAQHGGTLTIIYGHSVGKPLSLHDGDSFNRDIAAICDMQGLLLRHFPESGRFNGVSLRAVEASAYHDDEYFRRGSVLIIGGPASNNTSLRFFNQMAGIRYRIEYDIPDYADMRIVDLFTGTQLRAEYKISTNGVSGVCKDYAIVSVIRNPYCIGSFVISAMGIHGYGTEAAVKLLSGSKRLSSLLADILRNSSADVCGIQLLIEVQGGGAASSILEQSVWMVRARNTTRPGPLPSARIMHHA